MRNPDALIPYIEDREGWAFGYGQEPETHDCARFADGGVAAVTGISPLGRFTSQWTTRRGARQVLARHGGMAKAVSTVMTEINPDLAARGDVGLTTENTLVLIEGQTVVGLSPDRGLVREPRTALTRAWTI